MTTTDRPDSRASAAGRPRDTHIDTAVLDATFEVLDAYGYRRFTMEEVARRAETTKPAVYRRWSTRQQLVLAALARRLGEVQAPDTGCTMCDLSECIGLFVDAFECVPPDVLGPLLADSADDSELRAEFMSTLFEPPRAAVDQTLAHALERRDLRADLDRALAVDLLASLVYYRALFGHAPLSGAEIETAVETLLQGIATDYSSLLEHARLEQVGSQAHGRHAEAARSRHDG